MTDIIGVHLPKRYNLRKDMMSDEQFARLEEVDFQFEVPRGKSGCDFLGGGH